MPDKLTERFAELGNPSTDWTLGRRMGYQVVGLELLAENPILGVGPGNYAKHYVDFEFRWVDGRRLQERALHNTYLGVAAEYGMLGFSLFASLIIIVLVGLGRARRQARDSELANMAEALQYSFMVFLLGIATLPGLQYKMLWTVLGLGTAILVLVDKEAKSSSTAAKSRPS